MPTFLHTADIHLDSPFSAHFDAKGAALRRSEILRCVSDMIDRAKDVDLLLISGDLFDGGNVSPDTIAFLKRKFSEIPDTKVFIVAGNHDPYTPESVYAKEEFGKNVHVFGTTPECIEIPELKTRIYGVSFGSVYRTNRIPFLSIEKIDGVTDIILLHADLVANGSESQYNPIDKSFIKSCGADYLALGHIHKRSEVERLGDTYYAYPGPPEGRGFDECGDMGCYIGKIENGVVDVKFEKTSKRRMFHIEADISAATDMMGVSGLVRARINEVGTKDDFYKITLTGRVEAGLINLDVIKEELANEVHYIEVYDETRINYNISELSDQNTLCGEFVRLMQQKLSVANESERDIIEEAMLTGIEALLGGDA